MVKADSIGKGLGGFFSSPFGLGLLALGAIFIFRDKISEFFQSGFESIGSGLGGVNLNILPSVELPSVDLPSFELPSFEFPSFQLPDIFGAPEEPAPQEPLITTTFGTVPESAPPIVIGDFNPFATIGDETGIVVAPKDEFGLVEVTPGSTFTGAGITTFGDNLVDTLSEVLSIFPQLSASQARDALEEFPGLTGSQFRLIDPDIINITGQL